MIGEGKIGGKGKKFKPLGGKTPSANEKRKVSDYMEE